MLGFRVLILGGWVGVGLSLCMCVCVSACVGNCRRCSWIGALFVHVCDIFALFMLIIYGLLLGA